eukprot:GHVP01056709.1.p1 GENE.GHVP01056709.1~~GHVP01056709.1.p1  ORF type:complete len:944 (+),score=173.96 GHVP01056709.1:33-2834(+)
MARTNKSRTGFKEVFVSPDSKSNLPSNYPSPQIPYYNHQKSSPLITANYSRWQVPPHNDPGCFREVINSPCPADKPEPAGIFTRVLRHIGFGQPAPTESPNVSSLKHQNWRQLASAPLSYNNPNVCNYRSPPTAPVSKGIGSPYVSPMILSSYAPLGRMPPSNPVIYTPNQKPVALPLQKNPLRYPPFVVTPSGVEYSPNIQQPNLKQNLTPQPSRFVSPIDNIQGLQHHHSKSFSASARSMLCQPNASPEPLKEDITENLFMLPPAVISEARDILEPEREKSHQSPVVKVDVSGRIDKKIGSPIIPRSLASEPPVYKAFPISGPISSAPPVQIEPVNGSENAVVVNEGRIINPKILPSLPNAPDPKMFKSLESFISDSGKVHLSRFTEQQFTDTAEIPLDLIDVQGKPVLVQAQLYEPIVSGSRRRNIFPFLYQQRILWEVSTTRYQETRRVQIGGRRFLEQLLLQSVFSPENHKFGQICNKFLDALQNARPTIRVPRNVKELENQDGQRNLILLLAFWQTICESADIPSAADWIQLLPDSAFQANSSEWINVVLSDFFTDILKQLSVNQYSLTLLEFARACEKLELIPREFSEEDKDELLFSIAMSLSQDQLFAYRSKILPLRIKGTSFVTYLRSIPYVLPDFPLTLNVCPHPTMWKPIKQQLSVAFKVAKALAYVVVEISNNNGNGCENQYMKDAEHQITMLRGIENKKANEFLPRIKNGTNASRHSKGLRHQIFAASDFFLSEMCSLEQLHAMLPVCVPLTFVKLAVEFITSIAVRTLTPEEWRFCVDKKSVSAIDLPSIIMKMNMYLSSYKRRKGSKNETHCLWGCLHEILKSRSSFYSVALLTGKLPKPSKHKNLSKKPLDFLDKNAISIAPQWENIELWEKLSSVDLGSVATGTWGPIESYTEFKTLCLIFLRIVEESVLFQELLG